MQATRHLVVGAAGHIDHGKTALVRALTGVDTDRLPAEKARGITIDLGFAALEIGNLRLSLIDVPGHERFVKNMLAGATGFDLALLVVAADDSVMPQTREHLEILKFLRLSAGIVAITKTDLVEEGWLEMVEAEIRSLTAGSFLAEAPIIRTSAATGRGVDELRDRLASTAQSVASFDDSGLFRLAIDRSFAVQGHGTVVTGTVCSGTIVPGDTLELWPGPRIVRVKGIQRHDRPVESATRGMRAAINLAGVRHDEIVRGHELASPGYLEPVRRVTAHLEVSEAARASLEHRGRYRLHLGAAEIPCVLGKLDPQPFDPGSSGLGQLFLARPAVAVHGQPFIIRAQSPPATLAGGRILEAPSPKLKRSRTDWRLRIESLANPRDRDRVAGAFESLGLAPASPERLCRLSGVPLAAIAEHTRELLAAGALIDLPIAGKRSLRVAAAVVAGLEDRVLSALRRLHDANPRLSCIPVEKLRAALADLENDPLVGAVVGRLRSAGRVSGADRTVALEHHEPKLSRSERKLKDDLAKAYLEAGLAAPEIEELAKAAKVKPTTLRELLNLLVEEGVLAALSDDLYVPHAVYDDLVRRVSNRLADGSAITMAELRDLLGTTRKYAVPIGEHLDRVGLTIREGETRRLAATQAPSLESA